LPISVSTQVGLYEKLRILFVGTGIYYYQSTTTNTLTVFQLFVQLHQRNTPEHCFFTIDK